MLWSADMIIADQLHTTMLALTPCGTAPSLCHKMCLWVLVAAEVCDTAFKCLQMCLWTLVTANAQRVFATLTVVAQCCTLCVQTQQVSEPQAGEQYVRLSIKMLCNV